MKTHDSKKYITLLYTLFIYADTNRYSLFNNSKIQLEQSIYFK